MIRVGYKVDFHAFIFVAFWEWPANSIGPLVSLRSPLFYTPNLSSAIRIWMAIARKHKNLLSVTQHHNYDHYSVFMRLFRVAYSDLFRSFAFALLYSNVWWLLFLLFMIAIAMENKNHGIIALKVQIAWMHTAHTHSWFYYVS